VRMPVNVPAGGKLLVSGGLVNFFVGSSLTVAGELEIQSNGRIRLDGSNPPRDLTLTAGSSLSGFGTIRLEGSNRAVLAGDIAFGIGLLEMNGSSSISGAATLTISSGSEVRFDHSSTIPGSVTVDGTLTVTSASVTLTINGTLALNAGGTLNNPGTLQVGAFVNNGGTINGNAPLLIGGGSGAPLINGIQLITSQPSSLQRAQASAALREVLISWSGRTRQAFVIETSADLRRWSDASATITEVAPGSYQARLAFSHKEQAFFRVRLVFREVPDRRSGKPYQPY